MNAIKIASRGSKLALVQSNYIKNLLENLCPGIEISIVEITTKGDTDKSDFLYKTGSMGFFTSEVENALLENKADLAVHSLKDLPTAITPGLTIAAIPKREFAADALITSTGAKSLADLGKGAAVGTSSLRRIAQVKHMRRDLNCVPLRGNVETRVRKVEEKQVDAAIIACAGLNRLGLTEKISDVLDPQDFLPAPAQGALAVQIRDNEAKLKEIVGKLDDKNSRITAETERHILAAMHGGCSIPLGAYSTIEGQNITIQAVIADVEGRHYLKRTKTVNIEQARDCATSIAKQLLESGGKEILENIRKQRESSS